MSLHLPRALRHAVAHPGGCRRATRPSLLRSELVGSGGMGNVYRGRHSQHGLVALKCVPRSDPKRLERLENELRITQGIRHPGLVQHYELNLYSEECWLVMEYVPGATLHRWLRGNVPSAATTTDTASDLCAATTQRALGWQPRWDAARRQQVCGLFLQIAEGLRHLHAHGRIHRDLKPENIVIDARSGRAVIVDMGISVMREQVASGDYLPVGTLDYLAPELLRRAGQPSPSSDWYAFGLMLYEAVTGVMDQDYALRVLGGTPLCPRMRNPKLERDLAALCADLLQPNPLQRAHAERVIAVLSGHRGGTYRALRGVQH